MATATDVKLKRGFGQRLRGVGQTLLDWMPTSIDRRVRIFAWLSFLTETIIIGTGGAVRLTGSGLGCSEWPLCTPESLVPTPEQGIHGVIEFANRTMTGVVGIVAILVLLFTLHFTGGRVALMSALKFAGLSVIAGLVAFAIAALAGQPGFPFFSAALLLVVIIAAVISVRAATERRDLVTLAWIVLIGVVAQAFVGGITVLTGLNPFIVGFHYVASLALVCVAAAYLIRMDATPGPRELAVPKPFAIVSHLTSFVLAITVMVGVLTTGAGPHSGDIEALKRNGLNAELLEHVHAWPGYALLGLTLVLLAWAHVCRLPVRNWVFVLLCVEVVQIAVGLFQARNGLPPVAVGVHMVLASLAAAAMTVIVLRLKRPAA